MYVFWYFEFFIIFVHGQNMFFRRVQMIHALLGSRNPLSDPALANDSSKPAVKFFFV
jgi:hypothetical protein